MKQTRSSVKSQQCMCDHPAMKKHQKAMEKIGRPPDGSNYGMPVTAKNMQIKASKRGQQKISQAI